MKPMRHRKLSLLAAAAFLLAAVLNAYAFRIGNPGAQPQPAELAAYALPDGSLPELCLGSADKGGGQVRSVHCEFCRLIALSGLPAGPSDTLGVPAFATHVAYGEPDARLADQRAYLATRARDPPSRVLS